MVKGNWERRVELVAARRIENHKKKLEKQSKVVSIATGESVFTKLMNDEQLLNDSTTKIIVWLETSDSPNICSSWWRTENCEHKKCKYLHTITISNIYNLVTNIESNDGLRLTTEKLCECKEISTILRKDAHRIRIVSLNNQCIYDYYVPSIWIEWSNERKCHLNSLNKQSNLLTINEHVDTDEEFNNDEDNNQHNIGNFIGYMNDHMNLKCEDNENNTNNITSYFLKFLELQEIKGIQLFIQLLCSFLIDSDMIMFSNINRNIQKYCIKNDLIRNRKKEIYSNYFKEQNKRKKIEEKKKIKQANISKKNNKKDGFARGGNSK